MWTVSLFWYPVYTRLHPKFHNSISGTNHPVYLLLHFVSVSVCLMCPGWTHTAKLRHMLKHHAASLSATAVRKISWLHFPLLGAIAFIFYYIMELILDYSLYTGYNPDIKTFSFYKGGNHEKSNCDSFIIRNFCIPVVQLRQSGGFLCGFFCRLNQNYFPHSGTVLSTHARTHPTTSRAARQPVVQQSNRFQQGMAGWKARYQRAWYFR